MYNSLVETGAGFHLYIFAMDERSYETLLKLQLQSVTVISLKEFENKELLTVKPLRTAGEYCWTCTPSTILYCIETYKLDNCTYIDADLYFFQDPSVLLEEMGNNSVLITDHRYTAAYDTSAKYGKYCVQFISFRNDEKGMKVLRWWSDACLKWCYNRAEDNKFGDQKYLDGWKERFEGVHELEHLGGGVAPWNIQQYDVIKEGNKMLGTEKTTGKRFDVIFYHFHNYKYCTNNGFHTGHYVIDKKSLQIFYEPYIKALHEADNVLSKVSDEMFHELLPIPRIKKSLRRMFLYNVFGKFDNYYKYNYIVKDGSLN
jgi:hypothetical protein